MIRSFPFSSYDIWEPLFPSLLNNNEFATILNNNEWVKNEDGSISLHIDMPGVKIEDVKSSIEKNIVTVNAIRKTVKHYNEFHKTFMIPAGYDPDSIVASLEDGVLTITVNKLPSEKTETKQIEIKSKPTKILSV